MIGWIIAGLVLVLGLLTTYIFRRITWGRLNQQILEGDFARFYETLDSFFCKMSMSAFERENMRLSAYIAENRPEDADAQLAMMDNMRINKKQQLTLHEREFYYYLQQGRARKTKQALDAVRRQDSARAEDLEMQYSILIKKEAHYIDAIKQKIADLWDGESPLDPSRQIAVGVFEYLLGLQYGYQGDTEQMTATLKRAEKHTAGTPYADAAKKARKKYSRAKAGV